MKSAIAGLFLTLPFAILELLNATITAQNARGLLVLFGSLWLLAAAFVAVLRSVFRNRRAIRSPQLWLGVAAMLVLAFVWGGIVIDQMPCFLGVPNCD